MARARYCAEIPRIGIVCAATAYTTSHNRAVLAFNRAISARSARASALRPP